MFRPHQELWYSTIPETGGGSGVEWASLCSNSTILETEWRASEHTHTHTHAIFCTQAYAWPHNAPSHVLFPSLSLSLSLSHSHIMRSTVLESTAVLFSNKRCILTLFVHISFTLISPHRHTHLTRSNTWERPAAVYRLKQPYGNVFISSVCKCFCCESLSFFFFLTELIPHLAGGECASVFLFDQLWAMQLSGRALRQR